MYNDINLIQSIKKLKKNFKYNAIILSGSTKRVLEAGAPDLPIEILKLKLPILALCYGYEWIVKVLGGKIATFEDGNEHKYNKFIEFNKPFNLSKQKYFFYHYDYIKELPFTNKIKGIVNDWEPLYTHDDQIWIAQNKHMKILGLQFHPESHRKSGIAFYSAWINWLKENM